MSLCYIKVYVLETFKIACTEVSRGLAIFRRKENHKSREYTLRNNTRRNYIMQLPFITFILVARSLKTFVHIYNKHHVYAWEEGVYAGLSSSIVCKAVCAKAKTIRTKYFDRTVVISNKSGNRK